MKTQINNLIEKYQGEIKALENNHKISWDAKTQVIATLREIIFDLKNEIIKANNEKCENCKHFSEGKQPDGIRWYKCEFAFDCSIAKDNLFEAK